LLDLLASRAAQEARDLQEPVGEGGLAVVDVSDNTEVTDQIALHSVASQIRALIRFRRTGAEVTDQIALHSGASQWWALIRLRRTGAKVTDSVSLHVRSW
jgi:hypothetical protein